MAWDLEDSVRIPENERDSWTIQTNGNNVRYEVVVTDGGPADIFITSGYSSVKDEENHLEDHKHYGVLRAEGVVKGVDGTIRLSVDNSDEVGYTSSAGTITVTVKWERETSIWFILNIALLLLMLFLVIGSIVVKYRRGEDLSPLRTAQASTRRERFEARINSTSFKTLMMTIIAISLFMFLMVVAVAEIFHESTMSGETIYNIPEGERQYDSIRTGSKGLYYKVEVTEGGPVDVYLSDLYRSQDPHVIDGQKYIGVTRVEATVRDTEKDSYVILDNSDEQGSPSEGDVQVKVTYEIVWSNEMRAIGVICIVLIVVSAILGLYSYRVTKRYEDAGAFKAVRLTPTSIESGRRPGMKKKSRRRVPDYYEVVLTHEDGSEVRSEAKRGKYRGKYISAGWDCHICGETMVHGPSNQQVFCPNCNWAPDTDDPL